VNEPAELIHYFCPHCWAEVAAQDRRCAGCGADLTDRPGYRQALELALRCPEALTARRAAYLLGRLGDALAVPALIQALAHGDPYVAAEACTALARLGGAAAWSAVRAARTHRYASVRAAARAVSDRQCQQ
jgi:hypothetical protein